MAIVVVRANWKGFIKAGEFTVPVALYTAASTSERIAFHTLNRQTGHRVHRQFVDEETGDAVAKEDQVKGYEVGPQGYITLEPDEISAAVPASDKTLAIEAFIDCGDVDDIFFDRPYYLAPANEAAGSAFVLLREGLRQRNVVGLARAVLFRRVRTLLIRAQHDGLVASTLSFDYEVRSPEEAFADIPDLKIKGEMLELAKHIIETKRGTFDPRAFHDRYEAALADLVRAKVEGKPIPARKAEPKAKVIDLMEALRQSAGLTGSAKPATKHPARAAKGTAAHAKKAANKSKPAAAKPARRRKVG